MAAALLFGTVVAFHDLSALVVALVLTGALTWLWLRPRGTAPALVLVVVLFDVLFFTGTAAISNLRHADGGIAIAIPTTLAAATLVAFLGAVSILAVPPAARPFSFAPAAGVRAGVATGLVIALVVAVAPHIRIRGARPGDIVVRMAATAYSPRVLRAQAGDATVFVANNDLFWHTFTIDDLNLNVSVPVGAGRRAHVVLRPGRYRYYCRVPSHELAGMTGTLVVPAGA